MQEPPYTREDLFQLNAWYDLLTNELSQARLDAEEQGFLEIADECWDQNQRIFALQKRLHDAIWES